MLIFLCGKTVKNYHNTSSDILATFDCYQILFDQNIN
jgi:hypothetical protein